ncbi:hypothetical protein M408DRAFT_311628 [Serendipita vermifera MAFF 305830]|uniref:tyrosinase n=1 Tax=Serendipita vermifera MAFF 305830 TaxID=933852 RepID=A0A0C3ARA1_SERVB|nr:hypothetical protein M408DRAFT_311628 [Serendipita vermifera MAFF 305830]
MTVIVTGVQGGNTPVARQEIRTMMQDIDLFTLYLLGMERFQAVAETDPLSWFQIAGIHGRPYTAYDAPPQSSSSGNGGYCTHSSSLFPPWHRPYLALFEQALAKHVTDIANEYPTTTRARYVAAAQKFRIPYWDWAYYADPPDVVTKQMQVTLNGPKGVRTLDNPLYRYRFHPAQGVEFPNSGQFSSWPTTVRWPTNAQANATSSSDQMDAFLLNQTLTIRDSTYNLLMSIHNYGFFSNDRYPGPRTDPVNFASLETIHNGIHGSIGGVSGVGGHMGNPDFAAFDPIFWLHHTNVDRVFTLWQALNPNSYIDTVQQQRSIRGTFTTRAGTTEGIDTPLTPFRQTATAFWTTRGVRDTRTLNYTYPELVKWASLSADQKPRRLYDDINAMYGRSAPWSTLNPGLFANARASVPLVSAKVASDFTPKMAEASVAAAPPPAVGGAAPAQQPVHAPAPKILDAASIRKNMEAGMHSVQAQGSQAAGMSASATASHKVGEAIAAAGNVAAITAQKVASVVPAPVAAAIPGGSSTAAAKSVAHARQYNEWVANIRVEKYALKSSFFIHVFLGDFNPDPAHWGTDPNLVGSYYVFANDLDSTECENCQENAEDQLLVTGAIPLTGALGDRLGKDQIAQLNPDQITPYLTKELHWRIQTPTRVVEREEIPSLKISVIHIPVSIPANLDTFPTWGHGTRHTAITTGRPGGLNDDDDD